MESLLLNLKPLKTLYLHYQIAYGHQTSQNALERLLPIKFRGFAKSLAKWLTKSIIFPLLQCLWSLKTSCWWLSMTGSPHNVTWPIDHIVLRDHVTTKPTISPLTQCLSTPDLVGLTYSERLTSLKPHHPLITRPKWVHMVIWTICTSTFTILIATKLCKMLTSRRSFST